MRNTIENKIFLVICLLSVIACAGPPRPKVENIKDISSGTLIAGKIEVVPPLESNEQKVGRSKKNMVTISSTKEPAEANEITMANMKERIEATLGKSFFVKADGPFYINACFIYMDTKNLLQIAKLPGGFKVNVQKNDKAVYIGTIRYHRDEFFNITKVEVIDELTATAQELNKKVGGKINLRKALVSLPALN